MKPFEDTYLQFGSSESHVTQQDPYHADVQHYNERLHSQNQADSFGQGYKHEQLNPNNPDNYQDYNTDGRPQYNSYSNQE